MMPKDHPSKSHLILAAVFFCLMLPTTRAIADDEPAKVSRINPFELVKGRLTPDTIFDIRLDKDLLIQNKLIKGNDISQFVDQIEGVDLNYDTVTGQNIQPVQVTNLKHYLTLRNHDPFLSVRMPAWSVLTKAKKDIRTQSPWRGWLKSYRACLTLEHPMIQDKIPFSIEIPDPRWGFVWGIVVVFFSFVLIWILKPFPLKKRKEFEEDQSLEKWQKSSRARRFVLYPLNFAITPIGTYSISIAQVLLWTYVTIFGIVYVHWLTGRFIDITEQVLMLLGIGGGTALAAKINAVSRVKELPSKYLNMIKKKRIPRLKDLISIEGQPNIYKFQMLAFTLLTAYIVVVEIVKNYAFPVIPNSLVTLMGISGAVYLGNEFSQKNVWDEITSKVDAIEAYAKSNNKPVSSAEEIKALKISEVDELINLLKGIYA